MLLLLFFRAPSTHCLPYFLWILSSSFIPLLFCAQYPTTGVCDSFPFRTGHPPLSLHSGQPPPAGSHSYHGQLENSKDVSWVPALPERFQLRRSGQRAGVGKKDHNEWFGLAGVSINLRFGGWVYVIKHNWADGFQDEKSIRSTWWYVGSTDEWVWEVLLRKAKIGVCNTRGQQRNAFPEWGVNAKLLWKIIKKLVKKTGCTTLMSSGSISF